MLLNYSCYFLSAVYSPGYLIILKQIVMTPVVTGIIAILIGLLAKTRL
jgi:xanthine/uracil permease